MNDYILKKIDNNAISPIHAILSACGKSMYEKFGLTHWYPFMDIEVFRKLMKTKELYGIYQNETAIGTFNLSLEPRDYYYEEIWSNPGAKAVYLGHLGIDPNIQRKGLGKWCMHQIEQIAQRLESKAIRFDALNIHPWLKVFYEKLGYSPRTVVKPKQWELLCFEKILCE